jgi:adenosylcobinamide-phosphate synthase
MTDFLTAALILPLALALDAWLGEPRRFHPLVGFGGLAQALEERLHGDARWRGALALALLVLPPVLVTALCDGQPWSPLLDLLVLYLAIGWRSLGEHANRVGTALNTGDLTGARQAVAYIVSRDTRDLDSEGIAKATVESVLENGNDAIFGALFWYLVAGAPGVILYRLTNTLDAMWGYRNDRYRRYGWAAARLDDLLNWVPARLTALSYALAGRFGTALACWRAQGPAWKSPNAGPVMAAGAGSLGILLGGPAVYHGTTQIRPSLGAGRPARAEDIGRALRLIRTALVFWVVGALALAIIANSTSVATITSIMHIQYV